MRIVLDATPLLGRLTGIGQYTHHLVAELPAALARAGIEAEVAVSTWTARGGRLHSLPPGVRQVGVPVPARLVRSAWSRVDHPSVETLVGRCAVFHGTNFVSPPTRRAREVVTIHDLTYELFPETVAPASLEYRTLVRRALHRGALVVTPSQTIASAVREFYDLPAHRVRTTPLGVDSEWFDATAAGIEELTTLGLPERYLLFVGSLDPRKNLGRLLDAHALLRARRRDVPDLVLAGPAGRATDLGAPNVHLTGWLDDATLRRVVAGSVALALPSIDEGFGLPVLEALACGRPVVVSDIPTLREVADPFALPCDPLDVDDIARALEAALDVPDDVAARADRVAGARRFTWERCADATVSAYLS